MQKANSTTRLRAVAAVVVGVGLIAGTLIQRVRADEWDRQTVLMVGQTTQIQDTVLEPGKYVMRAMRSPSNLHIVQIFNAEQNRVYGTILSIPAERSHVTGDTQFTFWETPTGTAKAMRTWFYPGRLTGDEFTYPKHLMMLAKAEPTPPPVTTAAQPPAQQPVTAEPAVAPAPPVKEPEEIAQNTPPPPPPPPVQAPAATPEPEPATLPRTASPYPLYGLTGGFFLVLYGLLRLTGSRVYTRS
jgi:hypothetical protein